MLLIRRGRHVRWRLPALAVVLFSAGAGASPRSHLVADTTTPLHGLGGTLRGFGVPGYSGSVVAFTATRDGVSGIYADFFSGTPEVEKLVEVGDALPGNQTFDALYAPGVPGPGGGATVVFQAETCCDSPSRGLFSASSVAAVAPFVFPFSHGSEVDGLAVTSGGVLSLVDPDGIVLVGPGITPAVALSASTVSGASGPVSFFPEITFDEVGGIAARGEWSDGPGGATALGIVHAPAGSSSGSVVADTDTAVPGSTGTFVAFGRPALDGFGNVAFAAQGASAEGVYRRRGGTLEVVADSSTIDPVTHATLGTFAGVVLDEGAVLFWATPKGYGLLNTTLYRVDDQGLRALYVGEADVTFDDGRTRTLAMAASLARPMAISGHLLAVKTGLPREAGGEAVVLLDVGIPGTGGGEPPRDGGTEPPGDSGPTEPPRDGGRTEQGGPPRSTDDCQHGGPSVVATLALGFLALGPRRRRRRGG